MIKQLLITALTLGTIVAHAQTAPVKPAETKPAYKPDPAAVFNLNIKLPAGLANDFLVVEQYGAQLDYSTQLTAAQVTSIKQNHKSVLDSINNAYTRFNNAAVAKFTADTTALYHPVKKK